MSRAILMKIEEPSDEILAKLMKEVAFDAKRKAMDSEKQLSDEIKKLVQKASEKRLWIRS